MGSMTGGAGASFRSVPFAKLGYPDAARRNMKTSFCRSIISTMLNASHATRLNEVGLEFFVVTLPLFEYRQLLNAMTLEHFGGFGDACAYIDRFVSVAADAHGFSPQLCIAADDPFGGHRLG